MKSLASAALLLGLTLVVGPACSSIGSLSTPTRHRWLYSGTRANIGAWDMSEVVYMRGLTQCIALCDFPWSLVVDTVVLPITLPLQLFAGTGVDEKRATPAGDR